MKNNCVKTTNRKKETMPRTNKKIKGIEVDVRTKIVCILQWVNG